MLRMSPRTLSLPPDPTLPFFSYGLFKPGELPYRQIAQFVASRPRRGAIKGSLLLRDGLPLLKPGDGGSVRGYVLSFTPESTQQAYTTIAEFEPREQYKWQVLSLIDPPGLASNVLTGRRPDAGSVPFEGTEWTGADDPVLREGLGLVVRSVTRYGSEPFVSAPPEFFDWERLFTLQMAYLFLWTVIERYCALAYGPPLDPGAKIRALGEDPVFAASVKEVRRRHELVDSRDPSERYRLDPGDAQASAHYYAQVRNNLTHRGKGTWRDGEITRQSLQELVRVVERMVRQMRRAAA
jgi:hypothetical protein